MCCVGISRSPLADTFPCRKLADGLTAGLFLGNGVLNRPGMRRRIVRRRPQGHPAKRGCQVHQREGRNAFTTFLGDLFQVKFLSAYGVIVNGIRQGQRYGVRGGFPADGTKHRPCSRDKGHGGEDDAALDHFCGHSAQRGVRVAFRHLAGHLCATHDAARDSILRDGAAKRSLAGEGHGAGSHQRHLSNHGGGPRRDTVVLLAQSLTGCYLVGWPLAYQGLSTLANGELGHAVGGNRGQGRPDAGNSTTKDRTPDEGGR